MKKHFKLYHKILPILILPICIIIFVSYGWSTFSTITERSGLNGDMYFYYNLTRVQFSVYSGLVSLVGLLFILWIIINFIQINPARMTKSFWWFSFFVVLLTICEIYLQSKSVGKG